MVAASGRHAARLVFQSAGVLIADSACSRIRVLHCYRVYRSPGYVPSTGAGEQSASFSVWANWRRDFPVPAAMSGLGNGPHIGLVTSGGSVPQSPDEGPTWPPRRSGSAGPHLAASHGGGRRGRFRRRVVLAGRLVR